MNIIQGESDDASQLESSDETGGPVRPRPIPPGILDYSESNRTVRRTERSVLTHQSHYCHQSTRNREAVTPPARRWRHTQVRPGAGRLLAVAGDSEGGRVARAARGVQVPPRWRIMGGTDTGTFPARRWPSPARRGRILCSLNPVPSAGDTT